MTDRTNFAQGAIGMALAIAVDAINNALKVAETVGAAGLQTSLRAEKHRLVGLTRAVERMQG